MTLLTGCVAVSRRDGAEHVQALIAQRLPTAFAWNLDPAVQAASEEQVQALMASPLTPASAFQIAQLRNPQMAAEYARLGIAQADVVEASRLGNPTLSGSALKDGGPRKITTGIGVPLGDLLLLPARRRFAAGEYERAQQLIAGNLVALAADIAQDWTDAAGATQVAAMRDAVANAANASATLAQRYYEAGNLSALEFKLEQAAASQARIAATQAHATATRARLALNARMGLSGNAASQWTLDVPLALPVDTEDTVGTLQSLAREHRLDLLAAQREVQLLGDAAGLAQRWRLLGRVDVGVERERETDGSALTGPTLSLALPLFSQGQAAIARAQAQVEIGQASLAQLSSQIDNEVALGVERVTAMRRIVEDYRAALVPQREAVVKQQAERIGFMLIGPFDLLLAKQQEYDAYQGYLEAVRDYWLARVALARAIGTALPSDATIHGRTIGVETILAPPAGSTGGHSHHGGGMGAMPGMDHGAPSPPGMSHPSVPSPADKAGMDGMKGMDSMPGMEGMEGMDHSAPSTDSSKDSMKGMEGMDGMKGMDHTKPALPEPSVAPVPPARPASTPPPAATPKSRPLTPPTPAKKAGTAPPSHDALPPTVMPDETGDQGTSPPVARHRRDLVGISDARPHDAVTSEVRRLSHSGEFS